MLRPIEPSSAITSTRRSSDVMQYTVRHLTRFTYDNPISESVMEVRMQPRTELPAALPRLRAVDDAAGDRAPRIAIRWATSSITSTSPAGTASSTIVAEAIVEFVGAPTLPEALPVDAWAGRRGHRRARSVHWDFLQHSTLARETRAAQGVRRRRSPTATAAIRCPSCGRSTRRSTTASPTGQQVDAGRLADRRRAREPAKASARTSRT